MSRNFEAQYQLPVVGLSRVRNIDKAADEAAIDKAAYVLKGVIDGVNVDANLVDAEILYLDAWMRSRESLSLQIVAFDLYQAVNHVLEGQKISYNMPADLNELIQNILEFGDENRTPEDEASISEFLSLLKVICADGIVMQPKITKVEQWITANKDISKAFPITPAHHRIRELTRDNVIDDEELANLDDVTLLAQI